MLIRKPDDIPSREITPEDTYVNRRRFMRTAVMAGSVLATGGVYRYLNTPTRAPAARERLANLIRPTAGAATQPGPDAAGTPVYDEQTVRAFRADDAPTPIDDITHY